MILIMQEQDIRSKIKGFISETFLLENERGSLKDSDSFMKNGIIDSTGVLEFISYLESEFIITIEDDELTPANLDSIDNVINFIAEKIN